MSVEHARALRQQRTWAEKLIWRWLRNRRFSAYKFRRQHPAGSYFLDFYCEEARLSIEPTFRSIGGCECGIAPASGCG